MVNKKVDEWYEKAQSLSSHIADRQSFIDGFNACEAMMEERQIEQIDECAIFVENEYPTLKTFAGSDETFLAHKLANRIRLLVKPIGITDEMESDEEKFEKDTDILVACQLYTSVKENRDVCIESLREWYIKLCDELKEIK